MIATKKIINVFLLLLFLAIPALVEEVHEAAQKGDLAKILGLKIFSSYNLDKFSSSLGL
jgi:competence protein ComGC